MKTGTLGHESGQAHRAGFPRTVNLDLPVLLVSIAAIAIGIHLLFREVAFTGLTWDEWVDYNIAEDYVRNQTFLDNTSDPSQARLGHLLGALSFAILEVSYFAFKLPFVIAGIAGGLGLWLFLRGRVAPPVAALATALYFTSPYVLSASRSGATAGDVLVCTLVLAFIVVTERWLETHRFWPYGALSGLACGLAAGAKWTCVLLAIAAVVSILLARRAAGKRIFDGPTWTAFLAHWWIVGVITVLACPTLLLGVKFIRDALHHSIQFEGKHIILFGASRPGATWYYIPAVLVSKLSPTQLVVFVVAFVEAVIRTVRRRRFDGLSALCILCLLPSVPLGLKVFQNAQYYLPLVPVMAILTAKTVDRWLHGGSPLKRTIVHLGGAGALAAQVALSITLFPDYLQAGSQFGPLFEGEFPGPAINHCQGLPFAVRQLNTLIQHGGPRSVYSLQSCREVVSHAATRGPERALVDIRAYPSARPEEQHYVLIPAIYDYESKDDREQEEFQARKQRVIQGCRRAEPSHPDYTIYQCPGRS